MNDNKEVKQLKLSDEDKEKKSLETKLKRKLYYEKNKEKEKLKTKEYYENNKEAILSRNKIYKKEWYKNKCSDMDNILFNDISNKLQNTL
jgi:hypothetical protein